MHIDQFPLDQRSIPSLNPDIPLISRETPAYSSRQLGLDQIHVAALRGDNAGVLEAIGEGNDVNRPIDKRPKPHGLDTWTSGEVPLLLAALFGHVDTIITLLRHGAEPHPVNDIGFNFIQYASEQSFSRNKRFLFREIGIEAPNASTQRESIFELLSSPVRVESSKYGGDSLACPDLYIGRKGKNIVLLSPLTYVPNRYVMNNHKSVGVIKHAASTGSSSLRVAVSGYDPKESQRRRLGDFRVLNSTQWNTIAREAVAPVLGFNFQKSWNDNGSRTALPEDRGRFAAGHVEVLLSTWYALDLGTSITSDTTSVKNRLR